MRVEALEEAEQDLIDGARFHEAQEPGLGQHYLDSLFSDIDSLQLCAGIHAIHFVYHRLLSKRFPYGCSEQAVIARSEATWQSKTISKNKVLDCFAALAMTAEGDCSEFLATRMFRCAGFLSP